MKVSKIVKVSLPILSVGLVTSGVFALSAYAITDNASPFGVAIGLDADLKTITFHVPNKEDSTYLTYTDSTKKVAYGESVDSSGLPDISTFQGFTFQGWYKENTFATKVENTDAVTTDLNLYAKFTRNNFLVGSDDAVYFSSNNAQSVSSQYVYKVASQNWGSSVSKNNANRVDLISTSGKYLMQYSSSWTIKRLIQVDLNGLNWWTDNGGAITKLWMFNATDNSNDVFSDALSFTNHKSTFYLDVKYGSVIIVRLNPNNPNDWSGKWNQTTNISFSTKDDFNVSQYSSTDYKIYLSSDTTESKNKFSWGAGD